jgi:hypothetical protein
MTRYLILFVFSSGLVTIANAQIEKRMTFIGGQIFYYDSDIDFSTNRPNQKNHNATFNLSAGKAVRANTVYGVTLSYSPGSQTNFYDGTTFVNSEFHFYSAGLFYRHYKNLATDFYFFLEAGVSYLHSHQVIDTAGTKIQTATQSGGQFTLAPGISYRIYKKLHVELIIPNLVTLQYAVTKDVMPTVTIKQKQLVAITNLNPNSTVFLGVGFHFIF